MPKTISGIFTMRILIIASTDSYNVSLLKISLEFKRNGDDVLILFTHKEDVHNHMLFNKEVKTIYWDEFDEYEKYEVAIYGNILNSEVLNKVLKENYLKISLFFHLIPDEYVLGGAHLYADYTFCFGEKFVDNQIKNGIKHNIIPIGIPFDIHLSQNIPESKKIFLFLEQHFYPSGKKGKEQLAEFLIELAQKHKNYNIVVKPRALEDEENTKHKAEHLYRYFKEIPTNLILLKEHLDLEELSKKADIVATTFSTAVMPAILLNKPVIFINGFSMIETYFYNTPMVNNYYKMYKSTGNIFNYKLFPSNLDELKVINKDFKNYLFYKREKKFEKSIIEFAYFMKEYKGKLLFSTTIDNYKINVNKKLDTFPQIYRTMNSILEEFYRINIITGFRLEKERKELLYEINNNNFLELEKNLQKEKLNILKNKYIEEGLNRILKDYKRYPIGFKGFYLKYLYDNKLENKMMELPKNWQIADYFYNLYLFNRNKNKELSIKYLKIYIKISQKAQYRFTHLYEDSMIEKAKNILKNLGE